MECGKNCPLMEDLEESIACHVCFHRMEQPKTLTCLHSFCLVCITEMPLTEDGSLCCPICRKNTMVPNMDPYMLPTAFFINQLSDILVKHERMNDQMEKHLRLEKLMEVNANHVNRDKCNAKKQPMLIMSATAHLADNESSLVYEKLEPLRNETRKRSTVDPTAFRDMEKKTTVTPRYNVKIEKTSLCTKNDHVFVVKDIGSEYKKGDEIRLKLWKYCSNNDNVCCGWTDEVNGTLVDNAGKAITFSNMKLSGGGWQLSCKANDDGVFNAVIKVNNKPVAIVELKVKSNNNEVGFV